MAGVQDYDPMLSFGEEVAALYDDEPPRRRGGRRAVPLGAGRRRPALELAVGTGRIALPLAAQASASTASTCRRRWSRSCGAKPGGDALAVTIGDFADVPVSGSYRLVYIVYNTLFNLLTQDDQVRCFENVAAHLADDGSFVVEALVPSYLHRLARSTSTSTPRRIEVDGVRLDVCRHDPVEAAAGGEPRARSPATASVCTRSSPGTSGRASSI